MGISDYVRGLRATIGRELLLMPSTHCVIRDEAGRILLVKHVEGRWMLPGGQIEPGETPADAARRECWEEAGVIVEPERILGVFGGPVFQFEYANGDRVAWVVTIFAAALVSGEPSASDDETSDVGWFTPDELSGLTIGAPTRLILDSVLGGTSFAPAEWLPR